MFRKIKWVLGVFVVFGIVIATNLIDRKNFNQLKESVDSIYEDRLVAKDIILKMTNAVHDKELALANSDSLFFSNKSSKVNSKLNELIAHYEETTMSSDERKSFKVITENVVKMIQAERSYVDSGFMTSSSLKTELVNARENLNALAAIQMKEGEKQVAMSKRALESVELFTQMEIYLLIFLAIVIQVIIIYSPKEKHS